MLEDIKPRINKVYVPGMTLLLIAVLGGRGVDGESIILK